MSSAPTGPRPKRRFSGTFGFRMDSILKNPALVIRGSFAAIAVWRPWPTPQIRPSVTSSKRRIALNGSMFCKPKKAFRAEVPRVLSTVISASTAGMSAKRS
ncbi:hypothetical protein D3C81_1789100 [compost metagenome]